MENRYETIWQDLREANEDDLLVILGASAARETVDSTGDEVVARFIFEKTKEAIENGKRRLSLLLTTTKDHLCGQQAMAHAALSHLEIFSHVFDAVKFVTQAEPTFPVGAATTLICRSCGYSLTRLCADKAH